MKESIVEFRILTKKGEKGQTANLRTVQAKRADRALERESLGQHSPPCSTTAVRMRTSCLPELSAFIPLPNSVVAQTVCGLKLQEWIVLQFWKPDVKNGSATQFL